MRTQKNWFKLALMTLAAVGLTIGSFTFSASAQDYEQSGQSEQKEDGNGSEIIVTLDNQFEAGTKVKVDDLELLCVPTHKEIYEGDGKQDDGQKDDGQKDDGNGEKPKDDYKYDHLACYKVKDYEDDGSQKDDKK